MLRGLEPVDLDTKISQIPARLYKKGLCKLEFAYLNSRYQEHLMLKR